MANALPRWTPRSGSRQWVHLKIASGSRGRLPSRPAGRENAQREREREREGGRERTGEFSWPRLRHPVAQCFRRARFLARSEDFRFRKLRATYRTNFLLLFFKGAPRVTSCSISEELPGRGPVQVTLFSYAGQTLSSARPYCATSARD